MLMAIGFTRPDPTLLSLALGLETRRVKFMIACRAGLLAPTLFAQQINTLSHVLGDRILINMAAGHTPRELERYGDFLKRDDRFDRMDEFLSVCKTFWESEPPVTVRGRY